MSANNSAFGQGGATPGVIQSKPVKISGGMPGLSFNPNQSPSVPLVQGNNPGLIQPHPQAPPPKATTPLKKTITTDTMGNTTTHEYYDNKTGLLTSEGKSAGKPEVNAPIPNATPTPMPNPTPTPQVSDTRGNAQTVLNSGQQTPQEQQTYKGLLEYGQGNESPQVVQARQNYLDAQKQFAKQTSDINQSGTWTSRALGEQGQANIQNSNTLNALSGTLSNALASQGQQIGALGTANSAAQTQAGRAQSGAGTVLGASIPGQISGSARTYNPLDPTGTSGSEGIATGANNQSKYDLITQYNTGKVTIEQAKGIEKQIVATLTSNPDINNQPLSLLTNLNQYLSGQLGTAPQQLLAQQVNSYIQTLGLDPASVISIANQQKGTLAQLLKSLRDTATNNNEAIKKTADGLGDNSSGSSSGGSYTSKSGATYTLPY